MQITHKHKEHSQLSKQHEKRSLSHTTHIVKCRYETPTRLSYSKSRESVVLLIKDQLYLDLVLINW